MSLQAFAREEMTRAGLFDADSDYDGMLGEAVMKMIDVFADEGHSGFSAGMAISIFEKVARYQPLSPLTGEDDEWMDIADQNDGGTLYQNKRCSHVFKDDNGAYDIDGKVFREPSGACFTSRDSRVPVTFPYTPKREYVDVPANHD
jgi:hypothetical protein